MTRCAGRRSPAAAGLAGASRAAAGRGNRGPLACPTPGVALRDPSFELDVLGVSAMADPAAFAARDGASALTDWAGIVPHGCLCHQSSLVHRCATCGLRRSARHRSHLQSTTRSRACHEANVTDRTGHTAYRRSIASCQRPRTGETVTRAESPPRKQSAPPSPYESRYRYQHHRQPLPLVPWQPGTHPDTLGGRQATAVESPCCRQPPSWHCWSSCNDDRPTAHWAWRRSSSSRAPTSAPTMLPSPSRIGCRSHYP